MNPVTLKISQDIIYLNIIIYFSYLHWSSKLYYIYTVIISYLFAVPTGTP